MFKSMIIAEQLDSHVMCELSTARSIRGNMVLSLPIVLFQANRRGRHLAMVSLSRMQQLPSHVQHM